MKSQQCLYRLIREHVVLRHWGSLKTRLTTMAITIMPVSSASEAHKNVGLFCGELFKFTQGELVVFGPQDTRAYGSTPFKKSVMLSAVCKDGKGHKLIFPIQALRHRPLKPVNPQQWDSLKREFPMLREAIIAPLGHLEYYSNIPEGTYRIEVRKVLDQAKADDGTLEQFERTINILVPAPSKRAGSKK